MLGKTAYVPGRIWKAALAGALTLCISGDLDATEGTAQQPTPLVAAIATYGFRTVTKNSALEVLGIKVGDDITNADLNEARRRVDALPGVRSADLAPVYGNLLDGDKPALVLYLGIDEEQVPAIKYREVSGENIKLPVEVLEAHDRMRKAFADSAAAGKFGEDRSQGHSIAEDSVLREVQLSFADLATRHWDLLVEVLHNAADSSQRAIAAQVLAYANDKPAITRQLMRAANDSSSEVRNNSIRALSVIFEYSKSHPDLGITPSKEFVAFIVSLLESVKWTDRNKAVSLLLSIDDQAFVIGQLREHALPALEEMSNWPSAHGMMAFMLVGRLAGVTHEKSQTAWREGRKKEIIAAAKAAS